MSAKQTIIQYLSPGTHKVTIPDGYSNQVVVYCWGAGGGSGTGRNPQPGGAGGFAAGIVSIDSGDEVVISIGSRGEQAPTQSRGGQGGKGNNPVINYDGGNGGPGNNSDGDNDGVYSGGGGGGATALLVNNTPYIVAPGGGGAGGEGDDNVIGLPGKAGGVGSLTDISKGGTGSTPGGGGGGGGYLGGAGGSGSARNVGGPPFNKPGAGNGGQIYTIGSATDVVTEAGSGTVPGGTGNPFYPLSKRGYAGYDGAAIVVFTQNIQAWIKDNGDWKSLTNLYVKTPDETFVTDGGVSVVKEGGWKNITRAWVKADGEWKEIASGVEIVPTRVTEKPDSRVTVNITVALDATNYNLRDFLAGTSYYPGYTTINLTINGGVNVYSTNTGVPALNVSGLADGDTVVLTNNGLIQGKGGQGGAAGEYTSSAGAVDSKGRPIYQTIKGSGGGTTSVPGRPGGVGGPGLSIESGRVELINLGTIAGGGGGGGGGGGPTGGQGGGGAGLGAGANAGTLTAAGAGAGNGGNGGAQGSAGANGINDTNNGGKGGTAGASIMGTTKLTITTNGTILGPQLSTNWYVGR